MVSLPARALASWIAERKVIWPLAVRAVPSPGFASTASAVESTVKVANNALASMCSSCGRKHLSRDTVQEYVGGWFRIIRLRGVESSEEARVALPQVSLRPKRIMGHELPATASSRLAPVMKTFKIDRADRAGCDGRPETEEDRRL